MSKSEENALNLQGGGEAAQPAAGSSGAAPASTAASGAASPAPAAPNPKPGTGEADAKAKAASAGKKAAARTVPSTGLVRCKATKAFYTDGGYLVEAGRSVDLPAEEAERQMDLDCAELADGE